ncbi:MAG: cyclodeaminase/cyclohydrolase family protein [Dehalococcoidia bacterium]
MLQGLTIEQFLEELAARKATPGGGSAAALSGALSAGLVAMAAEFSTNKDISREARGLMNVLTGLVDKDAQAFAGGDLREAAQVPLHTARYSHRVLELAEALLESCNPNLITDIGVAARMAEAAIEGALLNVKVNLISINDEAYQKEMSAAAEELCSAGHLADAIVAKVQARLQ